MVMDYIGAKSLNYIDEKDINYFLDVNTPNGKSCLESIGNYFFFI